MRILWSCFNASLNTPAVKISHVEVLPPMRCKVRRWGIKHLAPYFIDYSITLPRIVSCYLILPFYDEQMQPDDLLHNCTNTIPHYYTTTLLHKYNTTLLHNYAITQIQYHTITQLQYYTTAQIQYHTTTQLRYYTNTILHFYTTLHCNPICVKSHISSYN